MTQSQGGQPRHPEPTPVPSLDPEPPQPIPPDEPIPAPEPPHEWPRHSAKAGPSAPWPPHPAGPAEANTSTPWPPHPAGPAEANTSTPWPPHPAGPAEPGPVPVAKARPGLLGEEVPTAGMPAVPAEHTQVIPAGVPWNARRQAPGEGENPPPEHLGRHQSTPPEAHRQPEPIWADAQQPWQVPPVTTTARGGRRKLWISLATLAATLLLCGGGTISAYLLLRTPDSSGSPDPATAVNRFLTTVYTQQDATAADEQVCRQAQDKAKLTDRIEQIKTYSAGYQEPVYRWEQPTVANSGEDRALVTVQLTMLTGDEKAARQQLEFTVIRRTGWKVCEVAG